MASDGSAAPEQLARLYQHRFDAEDLAFKVAMWKTLCQDFFQRYVEPGDTVLDLGAGSCEFINAIAATHKIAVDLNPDTAEHAQGAEVLAQPVTDLSPVPDDSVDVVFSSNVLEHLDGKPAVLRALEESHRVLREGGTCIILMPNVRYLPGRYWDYFDHHTPLSHLSLAEGMELAGFQVTEVVPRFLPYTVKSASAAARRTSLVRLYLRLPWVWPLFGRQMLVVGSKPSGDGGRRVTHTQ
jgi:SAM-dependent methyltransferase